MVFENLIHNIGASFQSAENAVGSSIHDIGSWVDNNIIHPIGKDITDTESAIDRFSKGIENDIQTDFNKLVSAPTEIVGSIVNKAPEIVGAFGGGIQGIERGIFGDLPIGTIILIAGGGIGLLVLYMMLK